jgi:hypothetical protein
MFPKSKPELAGTFDLVADCRENPAERNNTMAVNPKPAKEKRSPTPDRQNAQSDHEGSAHDSEEFDVMNPAKQVPSSPAKRDI